MPNREDVINGLNDIHAVACGLGEDQCYLNSIGIKQLQTLINDATELLKEQEPRVMTIEDFDGNPERDQYGNLPCWLESNETLVASGWNRWNEDDFISPQMRNFRPWTSRPTDAQREATPWPLERNE